MKRIFIVGVVVAGLLALIGVQANAAAPQATITYTVHLQSSGANPATPPVVVEQTGGVFTVGETLTQGETKTVDRSLPTTITVGVNYPNGDTTEYDAVSGQPKGENSLTPLTVSECGTQPQWTNDTLITASAICKPPKKPPVYKPRAVIQGPCGDPFYRAGFNNRGSNRPVTFVFRYHSFPSGALRSITRRLRGGVGGVYTPEVHVLGRTAMTVKTASGKLLASRVSAPPGNYGRCP